MKALEQYKDLLSGHLEQSGEEKLLQANDMGKNLAGSGYDISDVVNAHFNFLSQNSLELTDLKNAHELLLETVMAMTIELDMSTEQSLNSLYEKAVMRIFKELTTSWEREEFLHSLLRHDLRNKNQLVQGYFELLEDYDLREEAEMYIGKAQKAINEGMEIIEKVRLLKKAEEEEIKEVDITSVIDQQLDHWKDEAEEEGIDIKNLSPDNVCRVKGGSLLVRVLTNIVENSIQHSQGNKIVIDINKDKDDEVICSIKDDGTGISDEEKKQVFKKGYTTDQEKGTGLGMYLVKTIIEIYGGSIKAKDSELGGARFDLHLQKA